MYEQNMNSKNYSKVFEVAIEENLEFIDISRDELFFQIGNARYPWSYEELEFYH